MPSVHIPLIYHHSLLSQPACTCALPYTSSPWPPAQAKKPEMVIKEIADDHRHLFQLQYLHPCKGDDPEEKSK